MPTPEVPDDDLVPSLLALSDVMGTGHHAALSAGVGPGQSVVVVGDGAVGLCAVLASKRLDITEALGVNTQEQLAEVEQVMKTRSA